MRKLLAATSAVLVLATLYLAAPLLTAWNIREAMKSGDAAYLADKIEWSRVKETLKASLADAALELPAESAATGDGAAGEAGATTRAAPPSLWQRFKAYVGKGAVDRMVETYANAEGLPKLFAYRQTYRNAVGHVEEPKTLANLPQRIRSTWSRVRRAEFTSPTRFEMEMTDKHAPGRSFAGALELQGLQWKLVSLHVRQERTGPPAGGQNPNPDAAAGLGRERSEGRPVLPARPTFLARLRDAAIPRAAAAERGNPMER